MVPEIKEELPRRENEFRKGDQAILRRTGLEVEVINTHGPNNDLVLCTWIDDGDNLHEVYFRADTLKLVATPKTPE